MIFDKSTVEIDDHKKAFMQRIMICLNTSLK